MFFWRAGEYSFYQDEPSPDAPLGLNLNPWKIVVDGIKQGYPLEDLRPMFADQLNRALAPCENQHVHFNQMELPPKELRILKSFNGQQSLAEILQPSGKTPMDEALILQLGFMGLELSLLSWVGEDNQPVASTPVAVAEPKAARPSPPPPLDPPQAPPQAPPSLAKEPSAPRAAHEDALTESSLLAMSEKLKKQSHFERLALSQDITSKDVTKAFLKLAQSYHPDRLASSVPEKVRTLCSDVFAMINEAHQTLSDEGSRAKYLKSLTEPEEEMVDLQPILESESAFEKGKVLLKARKHAEALNEFERAIKLCASDGEYYIYQGYALFLSKGEGDRSSLNRSIDAILKGLKMREENAAAGFLFLGRIYKSVGEEAKARKMYQKAQTLDPKDVEIARELRLMDLRGKKEESSSFWKKK